MTFNDPCALCGFEDVTINHHFLSSSWARVCWFSMKWDIRVEEILEHGGFIHWIL